MGFSPFGYETANDAEPAAATTADDEMTEQLASIKVEGDSAASASSNKAEASSGGAAGKFRKKEKKKKTKKHVM